MDNRLSIQIDLIINYLNNIININLLLATIGLILIYWSNTSSDYKKVIFSKPNWAFFIAIILSIWMLTINLFIYKHLITEIDITGLNPENPYVPKPLQYLSCLNCVFYSDLFILVLLFIGFLGKKYEKNNH